MTTRNQYVELMDEAVRQSDTRALRTVSWIVVMAVTVAGLLLLALARGHWWPSGND